MNQLGKIKSSLNENTQNSITMGKLNFTLNGAEFMSTKKKSSWPVQKRNDHLISHNRTLSKTNKKREGTISRQAKLTLNESIQMRNENHWAN